MAGAAPGTNAYSVTVHYADGSIAKSGLDVIQVEKAFYSVRSGPRPDCWSDILGFESGDPTTEPPGTQPESVTLYEQRDQNKICIAVMPTGMSNSGGDYRYLIPENQQAFFAAFDKAVAAADKTQGLKPEDSSTGWYLVYQDDWLQLLTSGELLGDGRITAYDGKELYGLCREAVREAGLPNPVRPEEIQGICRATLEWNGTHTITDPYALKQIEDWLKNSTEIGSASCWYTALLTVELENGETKTVSMATDDCASWFSQGVYYSFSAYGNESFYALFASEVIRETSQKSMDETIPLLWYLDWGRYYDTQGSDAAFTLMENMKRWVEEDPAAERIAAVLNFNRGLDGAMKERYDLLLGELYQSHPTAFAYACLEIVPESNRESTMEALAYCQNMTVQEVHDSLMKEI